MCEVGRVCIRYAPTYLFPASSRLTQVTGPRPGGHQSVWKGV